MNHLHERFTLLEQILKFCIDINLLQNIKSTQITYRETISQVQQFTQ